MKKGIFDHRSNPKKSCKNKENSKCLKTIRHAYSFNKFDERNLLSTQ